MQGYQKERKVQQVLRRISYTKEKIAFEDEVTEEKEPSFLVKIGGP